MPLPKLEMQFTEEESDSSSDECSDELEKTGNLTVIYAKFTQGYIFYSAVIQLN